MKPSTPGLPIIMEDMREIVASLGSEAQRLSGKTVLITGARGFLASYLADAIAYMNHAGVLAEPARLLLLVRSPVGPSSRLSHLVGRPDVQFVIQDVCRPLQVADAIHFIIHAASLASPKAYRADPVGTIDANSLALRHLLDRARGGVTESLLYFSSSEVYGTPEPEHIPTPETYVGRVDCTSGRACYIESKRFGETLCKGFCEQYRVPAKIVRPFHVYGPGLRLDDGRIMAELLSFGLKGKPVELLSDGLATRTFGYVSDATTAFLKVLLSDYHGEVFNVGADAPESSILELATLVSQLFGQSNPVKTNTAPKLEHLRGAPDRACPDLTKIRHRLNYSPAISLETGLARTIRWHQSQLQARGGRHA